MNVGVIGIGYVGLPTAICLASFGHQIVCVDTDEIKINQLKKGELPIYEKGLDELYELNKQNIKFSTDYKSLIEAEIIIIAVGTPQSKTGEADLSYLYEVANSLHITKHQVIAIKSTVPIGTNDKILDVIKSNTTIDFSLISMPEFLREGFAVNDFLDPDRIIVGTRPKDNKNVEVIINKLYPTKYHNRIYITDIKSAELIKYASNAFLATKIHYINEIANLCEVTGANIDEVSTGIGLDSRIGFKFLNAGVGFGGSCFPKDTIALNYLAKKNNVNLSIIDTVINGNNLRKIDFAKRVLEKIKYLDNPTISFFGVAFKSGTDDCRESSTINIIKYIQTHNKVVRIACYDKLAINNAKKILDNVEFYNDIDEAAMNSDLLIIMNEDEEFIKLAKYDMPIFDFRGIMPYQKNIYKIGVNKF